MLLLSLDVTVVVLSRKYWTMFVGVTVVVDVTVVIECYCCHWMLLLSLDVTVVALKNIGPSSCMLLL